MIGIYREQLIISIIRPLFRNIHVCSNYARINVIEKYLRQNSHWHHSIVFVFFFLHCCFAFFPVKRNTLQTVYAHCNGIKWPNVYKHIFVFVLIPFSHLDFYIYILSVVCCWIFRLTILMVWRIRDDVLSIVFVLRVLVFIRLISVRTHATIDIELMMMTMDDN